MKKSKKAYHDKYFDKNWNNIKSTWKGIKFLMSLKTVAFSVPTLLSFDNKSLWHCQKQPPRGVLSKKCSKNMQQIYWRTPMPKRTLDSYLSYCSIVWAQNLILHKKLLELLIFNQGIPIPVTYLSKAPSQNFKIKFA